MSAGRICNRVIATITPTETVMEAARRMKQNGVGTLVAMQGDRPAGILTDRDIVMRCIADGLSAERTPVSQVMTRPVKWVEEATPIEDALGKMAASGARRLVVTGARGELVGILALDDILDLLIEEADAIGRILEAQKPKVRV